MQQLGGLDRYITTGSSDRPMYKKAFQPRLGASYDLFGDERTVLFGGFGIYYDRNYWNTLFDEQLPPAVPAARHQLQDRVRAERVRDCAVWDPRYYDPAQLRTLGFATAPEVFLVANDMRAAEDAPVQRRRAAGRSPACASRRRTTAFAASTG